MIITRDIGLIETLKRLQPTLRFEGITGFNSILEINKFIENQELFFRIEQEFEVELDFLQAGGFYIQKRYDEL